MTEKEYGWKSVMMIIICVHSLTVEAVMILIFINCMLLVSVDANDKKQYANLNVYLSNL